MVNAWNNLTTNLCGRGAPQAGASNQYAHARLIVRQITILIISIIAVVAFFLPGTSQSHAQSGDYAIDGGWFFTQTGGDTENEGDGYAVVDDDEAKFWTAFQNNGGISSVGYPVTQRFDWDGFETQVFQKVVFQWRPEADEVAFINVFDDLHRLGFDSQLEDLLIPPQESFDESELTWNEILSTRIGLLDSEPALRNAFDEVPNPLLWFGLPQSRIVDYGPFRAIRLQRAVLQLWTEDVPWAQAGTVTVANGGDLAKQLGLWPANAVAPTDPLTAPDYGVDMSPDDALIVGPVATAESTYTLNALIDPAPASVFGVGEGKRLIVFDITQMGTAANGTSYNPLDFRVQDSDGFVYRAELFSADVDPRFGSGDLPLGHIVRGWVTFEVLESATIVRLLVDPGIFEDTVTVAELTHQYDGILEIRSNPPVPTRPSDPIVLGTQVATAESTYTLNALIDPAPASVFGVGEGKRLIVFDITQMGTAANGTSYNPLDFRVQDSDGFVYRAELFSADVDPRFGSGDLPLGHIVRGWVTFEVLESATIVRLLVDPGIFEDTVTIADLWPG